jgi:hypothetical protein
MLGQHILILYLAMVVLLQKRALLLPLPLPFQGHPYSQVTSIGMGSKTSRLNIHNNISSNTVNSLALHT